MDKDKVIETYKRIESVPMSEEANEALRIAILEIDDYDESELPRRNKNQAQETLSLYATYNFIRRQLEDGKSDDQIKGMSVDKDAVEETAEMTHMIIFSSIFSFPPEN